MSKKDNPAVSILFILLIVLAGYGLSQSLEKGQLEGDLRIALGSDLAGAAMAYAAGDPGSGVAVTDPSAAFLQMTDCCGTQAEFALAAGSFDMAVLCPDAAEEFLEAEPDFVLVGGLIENANVLIRRDEGPVERIGYMNGRTLQADLLEELFCGGVELYPMLATALPYALENQAVDAVVLDGAQGLAYQADRITALPSTRPTQVLVAHEDILRTAAYRSFVARYNAVALSLNGEGIAAFLQKELAPQLDLEESEELIERWKQMETKYMTLPNP